ncbi:hypothetical protein H7K43_15045 [Streptomyces sp. TYQ1024]|uniref:hypothetical protein n=1 Tax=Streptomyces sp. TYQ1024 TaxID=2762559 RepID=UPI00163D179D|nr:hypothetical protein [Streptomyces sp. TYQ1024]MBC2876353.1 hypothetical protein [Streptomyces sp. TYQ1024]UKW28022.1 hypothetical protein MCU78_02450 [Streptomyces sp. TYQ1024]
MSAPEVGSLVLDIKRDRVGTVMGQLAGRIFLRPPHGGREWEAAPSDVRPAGTLEELRAKAQELNERRRWLP